MLTLVTCRITGVISVTAVRTAIRLLIIIELLLDAVTVSMLLVLMPLLLRTVLLLNEVIGVLLLLVCSLTDLGPVTMLLLLISILILHVCVRVWLHRVWT